MPNPNQIGNSDPVQDTENAFTKMANEAPSFEDHIKQYKAEHPDAVEDIEKARMMAEAGNQLETEAAKEKLSALKALDHEKIGHGEICYKSTNRIGDNVRNAIDDQSSFMKPVFDAPKNIKRIKDMASDAEERAGSDYDKMQQLRENIKNS